MCNIGLDVHKRETQVCILTPDGEVQEARIPTERERITGFFAHRSPSRVLLETGTESEWIARCIEALGHEVVVADPGFAPMYGRTRRIKTDRRDARALAEACMTGMYRPAHRVSDRQRHVRTLLLVRDAMVRTRTRYINIVRARLRQVGHHLTLGNPPTFVTRLRALALEPLVSAELIPLVEFIGALNAEIARADEDLISAAAADPVVRRLQEVPGIGPITALAFVAVLDDVSRFTTGRDVAAFLGLVPRQRNSGDRERPGRITKAGNAHLRWLLVEAGWRVLRSRSPELAPLRAWTERVAQRRGKRIAVVGVARRLSRILYAIWRDTAADGKHRHLTDAAVA